MILRTKGEPINIEAHLVGKVTRDLNLYIVSKRMTTSSNGRCYQH